MSQRHQSPKRSSGRRWTPRDAYEDVRSGVTQETRDVAQRVIEDKIDETGLSGGTVQQVQSLTGEYFILVEVPPREPKQRNQPARKNAGPSRSTSRTRPKTGPLSKRRC